MNYLTIDEIKKHLNLESGFTEDDSYLKMLGDAVEEAVSIAIDDSLETLATRNGGKLPVPLKVAMLQLLGNFYQNRENVAFASNQEVQYTYSYIIDLYRNYTGISITDADLYKLVNQCLEDIKALKAKKIVAGVGIELEESGDTTTINVGKLQGGDY